jgi:uncharacterized protein YjbJ (UPF0337 family)
MGWVPVRVKKTRPTKGFGTEASFAGLSLQELRERTMMDKDRVAGAVKDAAGKVEGAAGKIAGDAGMQASGAAREAEGTMQNLYGQAKDAVSDATDTAVNYAKEAVERPTETLRSGSEAIAKSVHDNPLGSLLVAGGIGFALALLMTRQPRRPPPRWRYYG